jgi:hypothetical protein
MVENNDQFNADKEWESLSDLVPQRDVELPDEEKIEVDGHTTLRQRQIESPRLSDAQVFDNRMFPDMGVDWLNRVQSSEIFPDSYNHFFRIYVKGRMKEDRGMPLHQAIADVNTSCSIALGREGRFDWLAWCGSNAQKDEDKEKGGL